MSVTARCVTLLLGGLAVACPGDARAQVNDTTVIAEPGGVAAGRDITGNTINVGLTPEQVRELTEAAARGATGPLTSTIVELSKRLGVTEEATKTLLRIVGEKDVPLEQLSETLHRVASDYKRLQAQAAALNPDNPTARGLAERARVAITAGHLAEARQLLAQTRQAQIAAAQEALKLREQAQAAADAELLGAAASTATEGGIAMTERHYAEAADLFKQAVALVPEGHSDEISDYLARQADALYRRGDELGDNAALTSSIAIWKKTLQLTTRERAPLDWAGTQMNLGNALLRLGERESGTAHLDEAVAAYRSALEETTRERVPLGWALTQMNLGAALWRLGERESGTAHLDEAVAAYHAALEVFTEAGADYYANICRNNRDQALAVIAERIK